MGKKKKERTLDCISPDAQSTKLSDSEVDFIADQQHSNRALLSSPRVLVCLEEIGAQPEDDIRRTSI